MRTDTGSATVWWVCLCLLLWSVTLAAAAVAVSRLDRDRATTAADLAALAAAARAVHGPADHQPPGDGRGADGEPGHEVLSVTGAIRRRIRPVTGR